MVLVEVVGGVFRIPESLVHFEQVVLVGLVLLI